jgi:flagellum-specific ATP synthase
MADLVRMGAYRMGTDPAVDEALTLGPRIEALLRQDRAERTDLDAAFQLLRDLLTPERGPGG